MAIEGDNPSAADNQQETVMPLSRVMMCKYPDLVQGWDYTRYDEGAMHFQLNAILGLQSEIAVLLKRESEKTRMLMNLLLPLIKKHAHQGLVRHSFMNLLEYTEQLEAVKNILATGSSETTRDAPSPSFDSARDDNGR